MQAVIFYFLAALVLVPALFMVTMKNVFHSALWLIVSLMGVAGVYAMLAADFLFAVQLLVYAGGIMVILLFVVLLSGKLSDWTGRQVNENVVPAALLSLFLVVGLSVMVHLWKLPVVESVPQVTTGQLGELLLKDMLLPFEVISLVLVAAMVGAVYFSKRHDRT